MALEDDEWDLSKEKVQPLREGRCVKTLVAPLHLDSDFELELRTYSGDDPFNVWYRYIKWTEQNFPKGGLEGQLAKLIKRCLREFQVNEKYLNDPRVIRLWIKFACYSDEPVDVYKYMFDNSIGVHVALFYIEWALTVERKGDMKLADQVYLNGLKLSAEPKELLIERHQQFQSRVARNITLQIANRQNPGLNFGESEEKTTTLGRLKPTGHSQVVETTRTGAVLLCAAGSLKDTRPSVSKQVPNKGIPIYCDNDNASQQYLIQTHEWKSLPVKHIDNLENDKKHGVWSNTKVKQKPGLVSSTPQSSSFQIHVDQESNEQPLITPRKTTFISHTQPLSCHKASKIDALSSVRQEEPKESSNEIRMYQKDKIYNGLSEFSFEELRAIEFWRKKKEREAKALKIQQEDNTSDQLSTLIALDPRDPFDQETIANILDQLNPPLSSFPNYFFTSSTIAQITENSVLLFKHEHFSGGGKKIYVKKVIGEGGYATVYEVTDKNISLDETSIIDDDKEPQTRAMKVQLPPCHWEFYINCELRKRLSNLNLTIDVRPSIMEIHMSCFFIDASVFIMEFVNQGSLLDLVNKYKNIPSLLADVEPFAVLMTIELLHLFEQIHKCDIIHGDVKPDNFLLMELPDIKQSNNPDVVFGKRLKMLKLIDFGQSIDMRQFKKGATFTAKVVTLGFQCIEMRTDRPWTYQTDLFGLAGTIHVVLFGSYMKVYQEHGEWKTTGNFVRKWNVPLWKNLFKVLLNVPSCHQQPDLAELRKPFENYFMEKISSYSKWKFSMDVKNKL